MFEVIAIIAVVLAVAIAVILILAATKPDTFGIQRAATVKAPPEKIFARDLRLSPVGIVVAVGKQGPRDAAHALAAQPAAGARSMHGRATRMSVPAAWKSSRPRRLRKSSSSSIS